MSKTNLKETVLTEFLSERKQLITEIAAAYPHEHNYEGKIIALENSIDKLDKQIDKLLK